MSETHDIIHRQI